MSLNAQDVAAGSADLSRDLGASLALVGSDNVLCRTSQHSCGVPPRPNAADIGVVQQGAAVDYNECWQIPAADVPTVELEYTPFPSTGFFALR